MELDRALEIFEYNKAMLTCDMSVSRDPEHQDVSPDYYGKDAENLYYAIVCVEEYIKSAIPIEWMEKKAVMYDDLAEHTGGMWGEIYDEWAHLIRQLVEKWRKENEGRNHNR